MAPFPQSDDQIPAMKWAGIPEMQLEALETRQRQRITALEEMLVAERQELVSIIAARSGTAPIQQGAQFAVQSALQQYSTELTWKDKILFVVKEAGQPIHGKEIRPALRRLQPHGLKFSDLNIAVSVHLSKLVRDGALVRMKVKGRSGSLYGFSE